MHTATRLAIPLIQRVRDWNAGAHTCCYGLYAPPNAEYLRRVGVDTILGPEHEADLVALAAALTEARATPQGSTAADERGSAILVGSALPRLAFITPDRGDLPPLDRYAHLTREDGERVLVGHTETSRGCKHLCRHCPIVPVYNGRFRIIPSDVVMDDIRAQVARGARHITFGDADFFNGPRHALGIVTSLAEQFPGLTYDVTIKIEHLLKHAGHLPMLRDTGCLFVTSAVESIDNRVLALLEKGHTREDFVEAVRLCREVGLVLTPTFVAFTPWTSLEGYCALLETIEAMDLVEGVAPIQLAIRLLVSEGSRLLDLHDIAQVIDRFDPQMLAYPWRHPDARVDRLQEEAIEIVAAGSKASRPDVFEKVSALAHRRAGLPRQRPRRTPRARTLVPYLNEPWYC
ncbi:MAG: radical SAM protein [Acidobacteria bacterium]|nr:radical SAM protein [Acidobacteriota bacterium]